MIPHEPTTFIPLSMRHVRWSLSALRAHVVHVHLGRAEEQMILGIDAGRVVTSMKHIDSVGDRPMLHYPGDAVSKLAVASNLDCAVAAGIPMARPYEASANSAGESGEAFLQRRMLADRRAIAPSTDPGRRHLKRDGTAGTDHRSHAASVSPIEQGRV